MLAPLWWSTPFVLTLVWDQPAAETVLWWLGTELAMLAPPLVYAARRRRIPLHRVLANVPFVYPNRVVNTYYAWKGLLVELVLVPLGLATTLAVYEKGRA